MNINDKVKVQLTKHGKQILSNYYKDIYDNLNSSSLKCTILDYVQQLIFEEINEFQLWELMQIFGNEMYNGNPYQCFVNNEIILEGSE